MLFCVLLVGAVSTQAHAESYTAYDGNLSSTYTGYMRDILPGIGVNDHYVYFRSDQYDYIMVVGDLVYDGGVFSLADVGTLYRISNDNSYNGSYSYSVEEIDSFSLSPGDRIVYSDLGQFPQLIERGSKYEIFTALLIATGLLGVIINRIFFTRKR